MLGEVLHSVMGLVSGEQGGEVMLELGVYRMPSGRRWDHPPSVRGQLGCPWVPPVAWAAEDPSCLSSSSGELQIKFLRLFQCLMPVI